MRRFRTACAATLLAMVFVGCDGSNDTPPASPPTTDPTGTDDGEAPAPVGGLVATIGTNRLYAVDRGLGLGLQNVGDEPVTVRQVQLASPLFETAPAATREVLLRPGGRRLVLPVPYGASRCDGDADETFPAVVVVDDGDEVRVEAAEEYPGAIGRLHARECAAAGVRERADLRLGDRWTRSGNALGGELVLEQRRTGPAVAVDDAAGNVIFTVHVERDLRVTDEAPRASVSVTITAERCDPHAMLEVKRAFVFLTWVAVGDAEPVPVELEPTGAARAALEELLRTCLR